MGVRALVTGLLGGVGDGQQGKRCSLAVPLLTTEQHLETNTKLQAAPKKAV